MSALFTVRQLAVGGFDHNFSYLVTGGDGGAALIDPTGDGAVIRAALAAAGELRPEYILLTHSHPDHTAAVGECRQFFPAPVLAHPTSKYPGAVPLIDGQRLPLGEGGSIEVIYTPGHSPDSVCYRLSDDSGLFTGDTLFVDYIGFCEPQAMFASLRKLAQLPGSNVIYSGHDYGATPTATLAHELATNPYLRSESFEVFARELKNLD